MLIKGKEKQSFKINIELVLYSLLEIFFLFFLFFLIALRFYIKVMHVECIESDEERVYLIVYEFYSLVYPLT